MPTIFNTDRIIRIESQEEVEELIADPEKFLSSCGALKGLKGFNGIDQGELKSMRYHNFTVSPLFCRHCDNCSWVTCGWSSALRADELVFSQD